MSVMSALSHTLSTVAKLRRISYEEAGRRCWNNLVYGFLGSLFALDFSRKLLIIKEIHKSKDANIKQTSSIY